MSTKQFQGSNFGSTTETPTGILVLVLAGGQAQRMGWLSAGVPKAALPVFGQSILQRLLGQIAEAGFRRVVVSTTEANAPVLQEIVEGSAQDSDPLWPCDFSVSVTTTAAAAHYRGPAQAFLDLMKQYPARDYLLVLGDIVFLGNPFTCLDASRTNCFVVGSSSGGDKLRGVITYSHGNALALMERPIASAPASVEAATASWAGIALFHPTTSTSLHPSQLPFDMPIGDLFQYYIQKGLHFEVVMGPGFLNVNTLKDLLLADLELAARELPSRLLRTAVANALGARDHDASTP